jgi:hypothetical protein
MSAHHRVEWLPTITWNTQEYDCDAHDGSLAGLAGGLTGVVVFVIAWLVAEPVTGWLQEAPLASGLPALSARAVSVIGEFAG